MSLFSNPLRHPIRYRRSRWHPLAPAAASVAAVVGAATYLHWSASRSIVPLVSGTAERSDARVTRSGEPAQRLSISVVDGDTVDAVVPPSRERLRYRLIAFDTPETGYARCEAERSLGQRATRRLEDLVRGTGVQIDVQGNSKDRYGRGLATLRVSGEDVGQILIREGLAVAYSGRGQRIDWCPKLAGR